MATQAQGEGEGGREGEGEETHGSVFIVHS